MTKISYATGNNIKFRQADAACKPLGITLVQTRLHIDEIQGEDGAPIARDKAARAFAQLGKPVVVSDDNWAIPGLNGFPGAYMKSMNEWFRPEDWLNLTRELTDRRIILRQIVVYQDSATQKLFQLDTTGTLLTESRGTSPFAHSHIVSFDGGAQSDAEYHATGKSGLDGAPSVWQEFAKWYKEYCK